MRTIDEILDDLALVTIQGAKTTCADTRESCRAHEKRLREEIKASIKEASGTR